MLRMVKDKGDRARETRKERDIRKIYLKISERERERGDKVVPWPMIGEGRGLKRGEKGMGREQLEYG